MANSRVAVAPARHKSKKWENPKVVNDNPMSDRKVRQFIEETEGTENRGGDPRAFSKIRTSISDKEYNRQEAAMRRLKERGYRTEDE